MRIISKTGKLNNYADRDHSLQYITAMGLINGKLDPEDYSDEVARTPRSTSCVRRCRRGGGPLHHRVPRP